MALFYEFLLHVVLLHLLLHHDETLLVLVEFLLLGAFDGLLEAESELCVGVGLVLEQFV